ncbi:MAG TPA: hypothetical protein VHM24_00045, partial [Gemmatimonadaceae bacterium]|nr:hypothetical protein [Gemmatimonadaceae bacterium]
MLGKTFKGMRMLKWQTHELAAPEVREAEAKYSQRLDRYFPTLSVVEADECSAAKKFFGAVDPVS